jgi:hypothetical protein
LAAPIWVIVMNIGTFIILGAAWILVIGVAVSGSIALMAAEYEPPSDSPFHRFILALAQVRQREAQCVIERYRSRAATMPQERDRHAAAKPRAGRRAAARVASPHRRLLQHRSKVRHIRIGAGAHKSIPMISIGTRR